MIAEKAADMIRGRQLQPYAPDDSANGRTDESRLKLHLRAPSVSRSVGYEIDELQDRQEEIHERAKRSPKLDEELSSVHLNEQTINKNDKPSILMPMGIANSSLEALNDAQISLKHPHHDMLQAKYGSSIFAKNMIKNLI